MLELISITSFFLAILACWGAFTLRRNYVMKHNPQWFSLSEGARKMLGVGDDSTDTGYIFNMSSSHANSGAVETMYSHYPIINDMVAVDVEYIYENKDRYDIDDLHERTGFYPKRIENLIRRHPEVREVSESEWNMIYQQYRSRLDKKLAKIHDTEITSESISAGYHRDRRRIMQIDVARKELAGTPMKTWEKDFSEVS